MMQAMVDPDQAFGGGSLIGGAKRLHLLNTPGSLWQSLGIT